MQTTVIIADEYIIFRSGLKLIIDNHSEFKVIGEASTSLELFDLLKRERPDVVVINLAVTQNLNISIPKKCIEKYPEISFVLLTSGEIQADILEFLNSGSHAILMKESDPKQLIEAISVVISGEPYIKLPVSRIKSKIIQHAHNDHFDSHDFSGLTNREQEVLKLFSEGCTYKEIGNKLFISPRTVESHKNNILNKLELKSVTDMVKYAIKHEIINL